MSSINREKLKLIGAQIFFRHGARTPFYLLPNLDEVVYDRDLHLNVYPPADCDIKLILKDDDKTVSERVFIGDHNVQQLNNGAVYSGQLTTVGEQQVYDLGKKIHRDLFVKEKFLPEFYDPKLVYTRSTYIDRTINSARCFLAGFYTNENGTIQTRTPFEIEVHSWVHEILYPNPRIYPLLTKRLQPKELYDLLHDEHDLKKTRKTFLEKLNLTESESKHGFVELYDDIKSRLAHGFEVPDELKQLSENFAAYSGEEYLISGTHTQTSLNKTSFVKTTIGFVLKLIKDNFDHLIQSDNSYKFYVYATHDTTLASMKIAFDLFDKLWPDYASYILLKLYSDVDDPTKAFVHLTFDDHEQTSPWSNDVFCPYDLFLNHLNDQIDNRNILEFC